MLTEVLEIKTTVPRYKVEFDDQASSPALDWEDSVQAVEILRGRPIGYTSLLQETYYKIRDVFYFSDDIRDRDIEDLTERTFERYCRLVLGKTAHRFVVKGCVQGERWEFYLVTGTEAPWIESYADELAMWLRGNVYHVEDRKTGDSLGGIYAKSEEEALEHFKEQA